MSRYGLPLSALCLALGFSGLSMAKSAPDANLDCAALAVNAVRAEEFINYFDYGLEKPQSPDTPLWLETELAHLKLRYTLPGQKQSRLIAQPIENHVQPASPALTLAVSAAAFADALRGGERIGMEYAAIARLIEQSGKDAEGEREGLLQMVKNAERLVKGR